MSACHSAARWPHQVRGDRQPSTRFDRGRAASPARPRAGGLEGDSRSVVGSEAHRRGRRPGCGCNPREGRTLIVRMPQRGQMAASASRTSRRRQLRLVQARAVMRPQPSAPPARPGPPTRPGPAARQASTCFTHVSRAERVPATDTRDSQHPPHQRRAAAAFAARAPAGKNGGYGR